MQMSNEFTFVLLCLVLIIIVFDTDIVYGLAYYEEAYSALYSKYVQQLTSIKQCICISVVQPMINLEVTEYTHFIEETATLPCPTSSDPPASYQWNVGTDRIPLNDRTKYQIDDVSGSLNITQLEIGDSNIYHCTATNYVGDDTAGTMLTVEGMRYI